MKPCLHRRIKWRIPAPPNQIAHPHWQIKSSNRPGIHHNAHQLADCGRLAPVRGAWAPGLFRLARIAFLAELSAVAVVACARALSLRFPLPYASRVFYVEQGMHGAMRRGLSLAGCAATSLCRNAAALGLKHGVDADAWVASRFGLAHISHVSSCPALCVAYTVCVRCHACARCALYNMPFVKRPPGQASPRSVSVSPSILESPPPVRATP